MMLQSCAGTGWGEAAGRALSPGDPPRDVSNDVSSNLSSVPNPSPSVRPSGDPSPNPLPSPSPTAPINSPGTIAPEDPVPQPLRSPLAQVVALGTVTLDPPNPQNPAPPNSPTLPQGEAWNQPISRREFARWLWATHNRLYQDRPAQQIRPAAPGDSPTFPDLPPGDPDFGAIQGLVNAGIIPSPLTPASGTPGAAPNLGTQFQPAAPLTRETLLLWKTPLDLRQNLPLATIEAIQQTWGFQDAPRINSLALRAVLADFQNGDLSNIRRVFGYTTLLQPQKPVSRAEAAVALWYFGFQGQGVSAAEAPTPETSADIAPPTPNPETAPPPSPSPSPPS